MAKHQLIVITRPEPIKEEAEQINALMSADSDFILHLRYPAAGEPVYRDVLNHILPGFLPRITLGDHFSLVSDYEVGGVHLGGRQPSYNGERQVRVSKSCHSLVELNGCSKYSYVFLSPIFDSISKQGYQSNFTPDVLADATQKGIINSNVFALGGISADNVSSLWQYGFGGAAVLGTVWKNFSVGRFLQLADKFK